MKKRLFASILTLIMILSLVPIPALAAWDDDSVTTLNDGECGENATWKVVKDSDGNVSLIISGTGAMTDYDKVSATPWYGTYIKTDKTEQQVSRIFVEDGITHIGSYSLTYGGEYEPDRCGVTDIELPETLKSIGNYGLYGFGELTSISLPDSLTTIGEGVFSNCGLTRITIGANLTSIGDGAFTNCASLTEVSVAEGNYYAAEDGVLFNQAKTALLLYPAGNEVESYTIPDSVTSIGMNAFKGSRLETLTIGKGVQEIGDSAFSNCLSLTALNVDSQNDCYASEDGILFDKQKTTIIFYPVSKSDTSYTLPDSVTVIGASAFGSNTYLTSVTLPEGLVEISSGAFSGCTALTSLTLPDGLTTIGASAFSGCSSLKNITIPDSVKTVAPWAFNVLAGESVIFGANEAVINLVLDNSYERYTKSSTALAVLDGGSVSQETSASELADCTPVKSGYLFSGWYTDAAHTEEAASTAVGNTYYAAWTTVRLKESSINAAIGATIDLTAEREETATGALTWTSSDTAIATVTDEGKVTALAAGTVIITVSDGETSDSCTIVVRETGVEIDEDTLELSIGEEDKKTATLTLVVTGVEDGVSWSTSDEDVATVEDGVVTAVGVGQTTIIAAAGGYSATCTVTVVDSGNCGANGANATWKYDPVTKTLTISGSGSTTDFQNPTNKEYTLIPPWYTSYHGEIETIVVERGITQIGNNFARDCTALKSVTIPDTVTTLGTYLFDGCTSLTSVELPESVTSYRQYGFNGCTSLSVVYLQGSCTDFGTNAFKNLAANSVIYVKDAATATALNGKYSTDKTAIAVMNGGVFGEVPTSSESLAEPSKESRTFGGWYSDAAFETETDSVTTGNTYYAKWTLTDSPTISVAADKTTIVKDSGTATLTATAGHALTDVTYAYQWYTGDPENGGSAIEEAADGQTYNVEKLTDNTTYYCVVTAESGGDKSEAVTSNAVTISVANEEGSVDISNDKTEATYGDESFDFTYTASGTVAVTSSNTSVATVSDNSDTSTVTVTIVGAGSTTISVSSAASDNYTAASAEFTLTVARAALTITADNQTIYVGETLPTAYTYTVTGLVGNDTESVITTKPTVTCSNADANTAGKYTITASGADAGNNYAIAYVDGTLTVNAKSSGGSSSSSTTYAVSVDTAKNGTVSVSPKNASKGTTVTITAKPADGYEVDEVIVTDKNGDTVKVTAKGNDKYTFVMPAGKVDVEVTFVKETVALSVSFTDVKSGAWYYDAALYAAENGLMSGTGNGAFSPDMTTSRAMIWTILARVDGQNISVTYGNWYDKAQAWAIARGVSDGTNPDAPITREQLAVMLYGFAKDQGYTTANGVSLSRYVDASDVSAWAVEALEWAVGNGLISSMGSNILAPTGTATRAQVAVILMNFCENIAK